MTPAQQFLTEHQIKFILAQFVDMHGTAKTKAVPAAHYEDILNPGAGFAGFAIWGMGMQPNSPTALT
jgi:glutamine synthetase